MYIDCITYIYILQVIYKLNTGPFYIFWLYLFEGKPKKKKKKADEVNKNNCIFFYPGAGLNSPIQFVSFKSLSYCFKETIGFDIKARFASRP